MSNISKICAALFLLGPQIAAAAGVDDGYAPPQATASGGWINWLITGVFVAGLAVVAFKNARRTHLD